MEAYLEKIVYTFMQETNTNGTTGATDEDEILEVTVEACIGSIHTDGGFMVLRTKGWSINEPSDMLELLQVIEKGAGSEPAKS